MYTVEDFACLCSFCYEKCVKIGWLKNCSRTLNALQHKEEVGKQIGTFRSDYDYEIEYDYDI